MASVTTIEAVFEKGVLRPLGRVELPEGAKVHLRVNRVPTSDELARVHEVLSRRFEARAELPR